MSEVGAPAIVESKLCRYCQSWYPRTQIKPFGNGLERCEKCEERHLQALDVLAGSPPKECGMCQTGWEKLRAAAIGDGVHMRMIMVDGTYVLACPSCYDVFVQLCRERYKGTQFAQERKL